MRIFHYFLTGLFLLLIQSCSNDEPAVPAPEIIGRPETLPAIGLKLIASGLSLPVHITHAGDGTKRLFVVEKRGTVKMIKDGVVSSTLFLDLTNKTNSSGSEQGLLGIAFPPNFSTKRLIYVHYTSFSGVGDTRIDRVQLSPNTDIVIGDQTENVLSVTQPFTNHNGGQLAFGPDGFLYIGLGDGGGSGDPQNNAQRTTSLLGKILRIDVERGSPYQIPTGNPFGNEVWSIGLRNPWRFSFDRENGDLYIADVGENNFEEINVQEAASPGGQNYGWKILEGDHCFNASTCDRNGKTPPVYEYTHDDNNCSITGGFVYRGAEFKVLQGTYIFGDLCSGRIWGLRKSGTGWSNQLLADTNFRISSFGEDEDGNLYVADLATGSIHQIVVPIEVSEFQH